ncbi:predicted protein [Nematostella vectensis]|uniref:UMOD/GP2/OIT3-like D8C domain-containing protein n=1 Tax=Nematostella vectensis TaxID=45351 RepID=A7SST2_NEMVE|nr:predicted protein [Nematostella vectensis]|eukprot:XP_001625342.1 predicted protein [Nematostella vectensis]
MEKLPAVILILCTFTEILGSSRASCPVRNNGDPCTNAGKIDNQYRSIRHKYDRRSPALCDYLLQPGWYRFTSWVGGEIPTSAPAPNSCGTVAPIWMRVDRGTHPDTIGVNVPATACVNLNNLANGCYQSIDICLRKCTGDYYVYYLLPPQGCSMAYCAEQNQRRKAVFMLLKNTELSSKQQANTNQANNMDSQVESFFFDLYREYDGDIKNYLTYNADRRFSGFYPCLHAGLSRSREAG